MPRKNQTPPHTLFRAAPDCGHKRRYGNEKDARDAAEHQMLITPNLELRTYQCQYCRSWHLTRQVTQQ